MKTFGKKGVWVIFIVLLCFMLPNTVAFPGLVNTVLPILAETNGIDMAQMITLSGYIGWVGLPAMFLWGKLGAKKGAKFTVVLGICGCALSFLVLANVTSMVTWCISVAITGMLTTGLGYSGPALIANWFPTKKGIALGWATMGVICVDLFWTPNISVPVISLGSSTTFYIGAAIILVIAVIAWFTVKDTPEEAGAFPDNIENPVKDAIGEKIAYMKANYVSEWTIGRVVKNRSVWTVAVASGLFWMAASAPIICFYARCTSFGYDPDFISTIFVACAICSLVGSWAFGILDQKINPKRALVVFGFIAVGSNLLLRYLAPLSASGVVIGAAIAFACVGGSANLQASCITSLWGRWDYSACAQFIQPVSMFFVMSSSIIMGYCLIYTGDYELYLAIMTGALIIATILICTLKLEFLGKTDEEVEAQVYAKK